MAADPKPAPPAPVDDDLDDLDDVLDGLTKPAAAAAASAAPAQAKPAAPAPAPADDDAELDEDEFIKSLAAGMEQMMTEMGGEDNPEMREAMESMLRSFEGAEGGEGEAAAAGGSGGSSSEVPAADKAASFQERVRQTMSKLKESDAAQSSLGASGADGDMDSLMAEMMKQMEQLTESGDFEHLLDDMMQSLLSKDILHEPLRDLAERYPSYLEANRATLPAEDLERYETQYTRIREVLAIYEANPDGAAEEAGSDASKRVAELMAQVQELGQPPEEIMRELAPGTEEGDAPDCNVQ